MSNITVDILLSTTTPSMLVNSAEGNTAKLETLITYLQESLHTTEKTLAELKEREEKLKKQVETEHHNKTVNGTKIGGEEKTEESSEALTSPAAESSSEIETLPLQAPWVSGIDEASGQTYYYNSLTKQSQWMNPFSMSDKTPEVSVAPSTVNNILSSGSSEQYDGQQPEPEKTVDTKTTLQAAAISSKDSHQRHQNNRNSYHQHHKQHKRRTLAPIVQQSLEVIAKSFKPRKIAKPISAKVAICCAFKSKPLMFSSFEPDYFMQMVDSMIPLSAHDGECIINQGDTLGEYFYAIEKGTFLIEVDGSVVAELPSPDGSTNCFGELAMLFNSPRNATVRAKGSNCKLWALDRDTFRVMQYRQKKRKVVDACVALQRVKLLHDLSESQIRTIGEVVNIQKFKEGDVIIQKGDTEGREFFMIQDGIVEVRDITGAPADFTVLLQAGDSFGEAALLTSEPRNATIVSASDDVVCMSLSFQVVNNLFGSLETLIAHNYVYYTLNVVPLLKERSDEYIRKLSSLAVKETVVQGDILAHLYELCDRFAVIRKGTCIIEETGEEIGPGSYIGDEMFGAEQPAHFAHTVVATTDVEILEISWDAMQHISLGEVTEDEEKGSRGDAGFKTNWDEIEKQSGLFKKDVANTAEGISGYGIPEVSASMRRFYTSDDLQGRLEIVGVLGEGAFGRVELVKDKRDDTFIALKIQRKQHLVDINAVHKAQQERQLMKTIQHSFICQLYSTFQDRNCIYMALEFFRGGELFSLVDRMGGALSIQDTKFYAAPIVSALEYLHEQNIVYRDVKTENVVIDSYGYPILVDFGFAKKLNNDR
jgi:CRP-like cAMP-binding protein